MNCTFFPSLASGRCEAPKSKSMAHRLAILAAFADGVSQIHGFAMCEDAEATLSCLGAFGIRYAYADGILRVFGEGVASRDPRAPLYVNLSASTLRFFIPLALLFRCEMEFIGEKSLFQRPLSVYEKLFSSLACPFVVRENSLYVDARGLSSLPEGICVDADISSQFVTGLLLLYAIAGGGRVTLQGRVESRPYIELTLRALALFGVKAYFEDERTIVIPKGQMLRASDVELEGDYSGSAFLEALNLLGGEVKVEGLCEDSVQGDRAYRELFPKIKDGAPVIDIADIPDLAPILMALASAFHGATLLHCKRLRLKESDRGQKMAEELRKFGAIVHLSEDEILIEKSELHTPREVLCGHGDHRIVMALSVLLSRYGGEISGAESVAKSFPDFFKKIKALGIRYQMKP